MAPPAAADELEVAVYPSRAGVDCDMIELLVGPWLEDKLGVGVASGMSLKLSKRTRSAPSDGCLRAVDAMSRGAVATSSIWHCMTQSGSTERISFATIVIVWRQRHRQ